MTRNWTRTLRGLFLTVLGMLLCGSLVMWFLGRDRVPAVIRLASGPRGGLYDQYSTILAKISQTRGHRIELQFTRGSGENVSRLLKQEVEVGLVQAGAASLGGLAVVAPISTEVVHLIARADTSIQSVSDLKGHRIAIGPPDSGTQSSARQILSHYGIGAEDVSLIESYFLELLSDNQLDAAFVTTGVRNVQLAELFATRRFRLIPIDGADALALKHSYLRRFEIPQGLYGEGPAIPGSTVRTVATTAFLVCRPDAPAALVTEMLSVLYDHSLQELLPGLIPQREALSTNAGHWHDVARTFFDPFDHLGYTANVMESLAAIKELLVAFGAALLLGWDRWRRLKEGEQEARLQVLKERLDQFLQRTIDIEKRALLQQDPNSLQNLLREASHVKLEALDELTQEDLRGDRMFSIFLQQCSNLTQSLQGQLKLAKESGG